MRGTTATALVLLLSACALPRPIERIERDVIDRGQPEADYQGVHTDLIRGMIAQGQYFAAIAHIQEQQLQKGDRPELRLLLAESYSLVGRRGEAEALYRQLLAGPFGPEAHHGLGLLMARAGRTGAVDHLETAVRRRPTNARMRNDLGFALLRAGDFLGARQELSTAVELEPGVPQWRNNLIILLLASGDQAGAAKLARAAGIPGEDFRALRAQADRLRPTIAKTEGS